MLDTQGSEGSLGTHIAFPLAYIFSLKSNCTEQTQLFKLDLETKSTAANFI